MQPAACWLRGSVGAERSAVIGGDWWAEGDEAADRLHGSQSHLLSDHILTFLPNGTVPCSLSLRVI